MNRSVRPFRSSLHLPTNDVIGKVSFVDDFLSAQECDAVESLAAGINEQAGKTGKAGKQDSARHSAIRFVWPDANSAWLFDKLEMAAMRLNQSYGFELLGFHEGAQVARYEPGGHYDWHVDIGEQTQSARKLSISIQLSDGDAYDGGDLEFLAATDARAPRARGSLIAFPSFVTHKVHPVTRGERKSLVSWISGPPFR